MNESVQVARWYVISIGSLVDHEFIQLDYLYEIHTVNTPFVSHIGAYFHKK